MCKHNEKNKDYDFIKLKTDNLNESTASDSIPSIRRESKFIRSSN